MAKQYKTVNKLGRALENIDNALSEIKIAFEYLEDLKIGDDGLLGMKEVMNRFDFSSLVAIKNEVEELIVEKDPNYFRQ